MWGQRSLRQPQQMQMPHPPTALLQALSRRTQHQLLTRKNKNTPDRNRGYFVSKSVYLTASFKTLPALNFGFIEAAICIFSPVRGLIPCRAARFATRNVPNPAMATSSPRLIVFEIVSKTASTAAWASFFFSMPVAFINASMSPTLFIRFAYPMPNYELMLIYECVLVDSHYICSFASVYLLYLTLQKNANSAIQHLIHPACFNSCAMIFN